MEAYKRTGERLNSQQAIALASDQRALVGAGVSVTAAALTSARTNPGDIYQLVAIALFVVAAIISLLSATPQPLYTSGSHSKDMKNAIEGNAAFGEVILELCRVNDEYIDLNEGMALKRSRRFTAFILSFLLGSMGLLFGAVVETWGKQGV